MSIEHPSFDVSEGRVFKDTKNTKNEATAICNRNDVVSSRSGLTTPQAGRL